MLEITTRCLQGEYGVEITPKTNSLTFLPKGISRDESNHLLCMSNIMNFSKFSCSHSSNFLSDSIGKQSAMSKRRQEATSTEGSPMAKPKPAVPAKARPINLVLHSPWSARETLSQNLGYPVSPGNTDEGQGDLTRTRKLVQTTQNPEVERSQVERQEYMLKVQILGNSTIRRKLRTLLAQGNLCRQQLQERNFKI